MRLFIASPVRLFDYDNLQAQYASVLTGKWVEAYNLHLTWIFLGERQNADTIIRRLRGVVHRLEQPVSLASVGYFGKPPRILYAKAEASILFDQARAFKAAGFELYRFTPHATLCRIKHIANYAAFKRLKTDYKGVVLGEIVPQITLYRSTLDANGPHYEALFTLPLPS